VAANAMTKICKLAVLVKDDIIYSARRGPTPGSL
jgi:hypothetical protein